ncbi:MAG: DNA-binding protein [Lachnospiraceae bacterium]|nr:DNA-binding protein [Lachnospiraceae bacterium]
MEGRARKAYLYDFYGELLNEHQRQVYSDFVFNDMSLGEIAEDEGISRQGVSDLIKRCDAKLENYESRLHLVDKFMKIKSDVEKIHKSAEILKASEDLCKNAEILKNIVGIEEISNQIIEEL